MSENKQEQSSGIGSDTPDCYTSSVFAKLKNQTNFNENLGKDFIDFDVRVFLETTINDVDSFIKTEVSLMSKLDASLMLYDVLKSFVKFYEDPYSSTRNEKLWAKAKLALCEAEGLEPDQDVLNLV